MQRCAEAHTPTHASAAHAQTVSAHATSNAHTEANTEAAVRMPGRAGKVAMCRSDERYFVSIKGHGEELVDVRVLDF